MDLDRESKNTNKTGNIAKFVSFLMLVVVVVLIAFLVYLKSNNIDIKNANAIEIFKEYIIKGDKKTANSETVKIDYNPEDHPVFSTYKGYIVKCIDDNVKFIDRKGEVVWEKSLTINSPIIKTNGTELLIAGTGSKEIFLIKDKTVKWNYKIDSNIINAELSDNGYVTVVHEAKGFKGAATVFNLQGVPYFTRNIAEGFVITAGVSVKGKVVAINSLDTGGVKTVSNIEITDMLGKPLTDKLHFDDELFPSVLYAKDDAVIAVSNSKAVFISSNGRIEWEAPMEDGEILSADNFEGKGIILAINNVTGGAFSGNKTRMLSIDSEGKQEELCILDGTSKNIEFYDGITAVNTGSAVYFIDSEGKQKGKYNSKMDINEVKFLNSDEVAVITKNSVDIVKIKD